MRNLTATLCLTLAVLLGSAGMSWGATIAAESLSIEQNNDKMRLALDILNYTLEGSKKNRGRVLVLNAEKCIFQVTLYQHLPLCKECDFIVDVDHILYVNNIIPDSVGFWFHNGTSSATSWRFVEFHGDEPVFDDATSGKLTLAPHANLQRVRKAWRLLFSDVCDGASDEF